MIPVQLQPEPEGFDEKVRQKGRGWLQEQGIALDGPLPPKTEIPAYWQKFNPELWQAYSGTCGYLAIYFERVTGASSTDHFLAKSSHAGDAYEWCNYRLSCLAANRNKNKFDDVLDPVGLPPDTFVLELLSGAISPNPQLDPVLKKQARSTIKRLKLDSPEHRKMRTAHFNLYVQLKCSAPPDELPDATLQLFQQNLRKQSPFVWYEADRQGML